ncbi:MAG: coenzyme F420-0:L-glutamate ligase [Theionarchaea archaeon]|nr:coenzyme F420-0:L-glutamate ligase [Theionarchaea archaeon]MBU7001476.1 coenzyme F420-0:L-glutamate ligase [Theionarchaea archaeon]MBU7022216.1 coenzyme F420-0:L-glutamate ligase [Theionarchaea archaeon]MBU7036152.1 coenzyme F420-0:L-glutamate ligase [Theionarchaea archaeon]MBU7040232.1 coenzyme F420-0:L-glutamate ligase [Theionarchaea archaeon]
MIVPRKIEIIPVPGVPLINKGDDIPGIFIDCLKKNNISLVNSDVIVIAQTIISKAEGNIIDLRQVTPSEKAKELADFTGKDPRLCEVILRETTEIIRVGKGPIIAETRHGLICASCGIDHSNVTGDMDHVITLPVDSDVSARKIRERIREETGREVAVIINDTQGRPLRGGAVGTAIGLAGLVPIWVRAGETDLYGYVLEASPIAIADELASAASILQGQSNEGIPIVIIRGATYVKGEGTARQLQREKERDLFR